MKYWTRWIQKFVSTRVELRRANHENLNLIGSDQTSLYRAHQPAGRPRKILTFALTFQTCFESFRIASNCVERITKIRIHRIGPDQIGSGQRRTKNLTFVKSRTKVGISGQRRTKVLTLAKVGQKSEFHLQGAFKMKTNNFLTKVGQKS